MLVFCRISVRSKLLNTLFSWLPEDVPIYMKLLPIGGKHVAPEKPVVVLDVVELSNLPISAITFLSLSFVLQFCKRLLTTFGNLINVSTTICISMYFLRL